MKKTKQQKGSKQETKERSAKTSNHGTSTPTSSAQITQNFRQNSGVNSEDIKTAPDGLSDYH